METTPVLLFLCSAFFHATLTESHLRVFFPKYGKINRIETVRQCNESKASLVTVHDDDDVDVLNNLMTENYSSIWVGLHRTEKVTTWSNGVPFTFNASNVSLKNGEQRCEAIDNRTWEGFNCSDKKPFMCYNKTDHYILIEKEKNWCQAQRYCRRYYTDLVSISNQTQNQEVIKEGKNSTFWIGLLHDEWEWQDGECSTYREWDLRQVPNPEERRATIIAKDTFTKLSTRSSSILSYVLCSKGKVRIKVIHRQLTWEKAFDYCKANHKGLLWIGSACDQKAVEQRLTNVSKVSGPLWLGLRQSRVFGFWIWASDRVVEYSYWKNDTQPELPLSHNCGAIDKEDDYYWSDKDCRLELPFLCEDDMY